MFLTRINEDLKQFVEMNNNHKLSSENNFTPLQLLRKRIDTAPDEVDINWDEYDIDPEDLVVNGGEIDGDNLFYPLRCPLAEGVEAQFKAEAEPFTLANSNSKSFIPWFAHNKEILRVLILAHNS
jgi:hypothetical protein